MTMKEMNQKKILTHQEIEHKIKRIAYQIYETFVGEEQIILAGILNNGYVLANKIAVVLESISEIKVVLCEVKIDKKNPNNGKAITSLKPEDYQGKGLVLVDDVLNSGTTLIYGVKHFLEVPLKKFKTVVLVDRNHKKYPIKVDFKGISLSTSLFENVRVIFEKQNMCAYLS